MLRETRASSSPEFCITMSYSAASSVVASAVMGFAETEISTSAATIGDERLRTSTATIRLAELLGFIIFRTRPSL